MPCEAGKRSIKKCHSYHCGKWKITSHQYYLDPQRSGHSLFVSGHIQCILSLVLLCLKNMVLYLSPVLAKCAIDLRVTTIRGYYTQDHLYSKDAVRYTKIVKHHDSRLAAVKPTCNHQDPYRFSKLQPVCTAVPTSGRKVGPH